MSSLSFTKEFYINQIIDPVIEELSNDHDIANQLSSAATEYLQKAYTTIYYNNLIEY